MSCVRWSLRVFAWWMYYVCPVVCPVVGITDLLPPLPLYSHVCGCTSATLHFATLRMPRDRALPAFRPVRLPATHGPGTRLLQRSSELGILRTCCGVCHRAGEHQRSDVGSRAHRESASTMHFNLSRRFRVTSSRNEPLAFTRTPEMRKPRSTATGPGAAAAVTRVRVRSILFVLMSWEGLK